MEEKKNSDIPVMNGEGLGESIDDHPMNALMEEALNFRRLKQGDIIDGEIVSVTPTEVLVDVGAKSEGIVPAKELERLGRAGLDSLRPGERLLVYIVRPEDRDGNLILSIRRAEEEGDWRRAQKLHESGEAFEGEVAGFNRGGLIVRLGRLRGFVPASQLAPGHQGSDKQQPEERWARLVGEVLTVKVIEINRKRKRLILSERAASRQRRELQKERLLGELRVGEVRPGVVSSLSDFGAFVNLGGADGLVHLSELSWNRSAKPSDVLKVGQEVEVYILNVDQERKRIALSLKRLEPEPWTTVEDRYYEGQLVEGQITRLANFGAFALVNGEIEGLIHISELSMGRINHPQEVVHEREKHVMRIIRIEPSRRRMGLSLKRVADPAYADLDWRAELEKSQAEYEREDKDVLEEVFDILVDEAEAELEEEAAVLVDEAEAELEEEAAVLVDEVEAELEEEAGDSVDEAEAELEEEVAVLVDEVEAELEEEVAVLVDEAEAELEEEVAVLVDEAEAELEEEVAVLVDEAEAELEEEAAVLVDEAEAELEEEAAVLVDETEVELEEEAADLVDMVEAEPEKDAGVPVDEPDQVPREGNDVSGDETEDALEEENDILVNDKE